MICRQIINLLEQLSPVEYACAWDNVGLMVGRYEKDISKVLVVLDCDDSAIDYAVENNVDLIVSHHPLIFGGLKKINEDTLTGSRVLRLMENNIACYSMHTNFDIKGGMAQLAADYIGMENPKVLEPVDENDGLGRWAEYGPATLQQWAQRVKDAFKLPNVKVFGNPEQEIRTVAIAPGSGKDAVETVVGLGLDLVITGDIGHHTGTDAVAGGCAVIDAGHYGIEHIFISYIGEYIRKNTGLDVLEMPVVMPYVVM